MTRDEIIEKMGTAIAAYFGENDSPLDAAEAALSAIESLGLVLIHQSQALRKMSQEEFDDMMVRIMAKDDR